MTLAVVQVDGELLTDSEVAVLERAVFLYQQLGEGKISETGNQLTLLRSHCTHPGTLKKVYLLLRHVQRVLCRGKRADPPNEMGLRARYLAAKLRRER